MDIYISNKSEKKVNEEAIIENLNRFFDEHNIKDGEVSVLVVNKKQMLSYVKKYLHEEGEIAAAHPVLSFVQNELEGPFVFPPDKINHLGEIIASVDHAKDEHELYSLIEHGALHLLGVHHK